MEKTIKSTNSPLINLNIEKLKIIIIALFSILIEIFIKT